MPPVPVENFRQIAHRPHGPALGHGKPQIPVNIAVAQFRAFIGAARPQPELAPQSGPGRGQPLKSCEVFWLARSEAEHFIRGSEGLQIHEDEIHIRLAPQQSLGFFKIGGLQQIIRTVQKHCGRAACRKGRVETRGNAPVDLMPHAFDARIVKACGHGQGIAVRGAVIHKNRFPVRPGLSLQSLDHLGHIRLL